MDGNAPNEIKLWHTYNLKMVSKPMANKITQKKEKANFVNKAVIKAQKEEEKSISAQEHKQNLKAVGQQNSSLQMQTRIKKTRKRLPANVIPKEQKEFEIEKLVAKDKIDGLVHYKVRWLGYSAKDDTWESHAKLKSTHMNMIQAFNRLKK
jgi:hypothetical protein